MVVVEFGEIQGYDPDNASLKHPRFCMSVNVEKMMGNKVELTVVVHGVFF